MPGLIEETVATLPRVVRVKKNKGLWVAVPEPPDVYFSEGDRSRSLVLMVMFILFPQR